jgi:hypothetical protein
MCSKQNIVRKPSESDRSVVTKSQNLRRRSTFVDSPASKIFQARVLLFATISEISTAAANALVGA